MDQADIASAQPELTVSFGVSQISQELNATGTTACIECGQPISAARRKVAPYAKHCIPCKEDLEVRGRHYRRA